MLYIFYFLSIVSVLFTILVVIEHRPIYALLYLIASFLSISGIFFTLGAFFAAALEVIIYAGAIMLLFVFVIMMLNLGERVEFEEKETIRYTNWKIPGCISIVFILTLFFLFYHLHNKFNLLAKVINVQEIGVDLFTNYLLLIEISSVLLLAALVIVFHLNQEIKLNNIKLSVNNNVIKK